MISSQATVNWLLFKLRRTIINEDGIQPLVVRCVANLLPSREDVSVL
jgi:hypothetical protein